MWDEMCAWTIIALNGIGGGGGGRLQMHQLVNKVIAQQHVKCNNEPHSQQQQLNTSLITSPFYCPSPVYLRGRQKSFIAIRPPFFNRMEIAGEQDALELYSINLVDGEEVADYYDDCSRIEGV